MIRALLSADLILRFIPAIICALSGEIRIGDGLKASEIGYLPQQTAAQKDFPAGVFEVVLSGRQSKRTPRPLYTRSNKRILRGLLRVVAALPRPFYSRADRQIALGNLEKLGITELKNKCCHPAPSVLSKSCWQHPCHEPFGRTTERCFNGIQYLRLALTSLTIEDEHGAEYVST